MVTQREAAPAGRPLQRRLSVLDGIAIGVGSVIGVGIFRTTGEVLRAAGSSAQALAIWLVVGLVSLAGARAFARVSVRIPEAGGPYAYVREALGARAAFVDGWFGAAVSIPARQAAQMVILGEVVALQLGASARTWALLTLAALYLVHLAGVHVGASVQRILTTLKLLLLGGAILVAWLAHPAAATTTTIAQPLSLSVGIAGAFYTYLGWHDVTLLAEELRDPSRTLPRVLVGTVFIVLVAYVGWVIALTHVYGAGPIAQSDLPVRTLALERLGRRGALVVTNGMLACMIGAAAEGVFVRPRLWYALARDRIAPAHFRRVDERGVPRAALTVQCALMAALIALGTFTQLLVMLTVAQALLSTLEAASAAVLERRWGRRWPIEAALFAGVNLALAGLLAVEHVGPFLVALSLFAVFAALASAATVPIGQPTREPDA